jgi:hypothetical protein
MLIQKTMEMSKGTGQMEDGSQIAIKKTEDMDAGRTSM